MAGILYIISDILSIITITLCFILKIPQIIKLYKAGEASGISLKGLLLELSSYCVTMLYNYTNQHSLLSYLEYPIIIIQEYIVILLVLHYQKQKPSVFLKVLAVSFSAIFAFGLQIISKKILTILLPFTTPVGAISKVMQLVEIIRKKDARSVSALTWFLSCFTNLTRIYTIYLDSADPNLLMNFTVSAGLSGSVLAATLYYQKQADKRGLKSN
ncbi:UNVERIFIED_CONTAM: hypothetical protein PYX00_001568 [Menopon gallinae]|uniref:Solute carrier family 66 member 3 n=1 Tax=Menopon gallinae TaxID=328185 RepID=A0AAW2IEH4_9NEOP